MWTDIVEGIARSVAERIKLRRVLAEAVLLAGLALTASVLVR